MGPCHVECIDSTTSLRTFPCFPSFLQGPNSLVERGREDPKEGGRRWRKRESVVPGSGVRPDRPKLGIPREVDVWIGLRLVTTRMRCSELCRQSSGEPTEQAWRLGLEEWKAFSSVHPADFQCFPAPVHTSKRGPRAGTTLALPSLDPPRPSAPAALLPPPHGAAATVISFPPGHKPRLPSRAIEALRGWALEKKLPACSFFHIPQHTRLRPAQSSTSTCCLSLLKPGTTAALAVPTPVRLDLQAQLRHHIPMARFPISPSLYCHHYFVCAFRTRPHCAFHYGVV